MTTLIFACALWSAIFVGKSLQECRILTECNGQPEYHSFSENAQTQSGRGVVIGKRGRRGSPGQKGEPGGPTNISDLKHLLKLNETSVPRRYYYESTLTWTSAKAFCDRFDQIMCSYDQICEYHNGGRKLVGSVVPADHWVPLLDQYNDWTEIGDAQHVSPCKRHISLFGPPSWGTTSSANVYKGFVYCCDKQSIDKASSPDIIYQYIGRGATYESSKQHCMKFDRRLCYSGEVCQTDLPRYGTTRENDWIAVKDSHNEWMYIGHEGKPCELYSARHPAPSWGVRENGKLINYVGFVYCCKDLDVREEEDGQQE